MSKGKTALEIDMKGALRRNETSIPTERSVEVEEAYGLRPAPIYLGIGIDAAVALRMSETLKRG